MVNRGRGDVASRGDGEELNIITLHADELSNRGGIEGNNAGEVVGIELQSGTRKTIQVPKGDDWLGGRNA